jgi:hypothetical protein
LTDLRKISQRPFRGQQFDGATKDFSYLMPLVSDGAVVILCIIYYWENAAFFVIFQKLSAEKS